MADRIATHGTHFVCSKTNRILQLRGVSLSGSSKLPTGLPSHSPDKAAFLDHASVSYVGRPFELSEMHDHLSRIASWGFTLIRLVVTWEAIEHEGWQKYDQDYLNYIATIVRALPEYGLSCIIDAHQDVFSRLTGGSGAPGWVLDVLGLSLPDLQGTHAAHLHPLALLATDPPPSVWPTGYQKLAASTCNTIFWAGDQFAYKRTAPDGSGRGLSTFLQTAMCDAFGQLADSLEDCEAVLGFEPMNEPHRGYLELHDIFTFDSNTDLQLGYHASALQSFAIGDGYPQQIPYYVPTFPEPTCVSHYATVNASRTRAWKPGHACIWREHDVWDWNERSKKPVALRHGYFEKDPRTGQKFEWYRDAWWPFLKRFRERIVRGRGLRKRWMTFAAGIPNEFTPAWPAADQPENFISAPHWYDLHSLFSKSFGNFTFNVQGLSRGMFPLQAVYYGREGVRNNYALQLGNIVQSSDTSTGRPCLIGECGIPFDMNAFFRLHPTPSGKGKKRDFRWQERQLDALCTGLERSLTSYVLWNYNPENEDTHGDSWYMENFSLFSMSEWDEETGKQGAGRCMDAFQRPYAKATPGVPTKSAFDMFDLSFTYEFRVPAASEGLPTPSVLETEIYLPGRRYGHLFATNSVHIALSHGGSWSWDVKSQLLLWKHEALHAGSTHTLRLTVPDSKHWKAKPSNIDLQDSPLRWVLAVLLAVLAAVLAYCMS